MVQGDLHVYDCVHLQVNKGNNDILFDVFPVYFYLAKVRMTGISWCPSADPSTMGFAMPPLSHPISFPGTKEIAKFASIVDSTISAEKSHIISLGKGNRNRKGRTQLYLGELETTIRKMHEHQSQRRASQETERTCMPSVLQEKSTNGYISPVTSSPASFRGNPLGLDWHLIRRATSLVSTHPRQVPKGQCCGWQEAFRRRRPCPWERRSNRRTFRLFQ